MIVALMLSAWALLHTASILSDVLIGTDPGRRIWSLDVDTEQSAHTWFSTLLLALASLVLAVVTAVVWNAARAGTRKGGATAYV